MQTSHSLQDVVDFLNHTDSRGLMPTATAQALAVAVRNVFSVLDVAEQSSLPLDDIDGVIRRFENKRARDFSPSSLKEYGRRVHRAVALYEQWKKEPAGFSVKTRSTNSKSKGSRSTTSTRSAGKVVNSDEREPATAPVLAQSPTPLNPGQGYSSSFPVRSGHVVTISNIPPDMTSNEAERLAQFVRMLGST